ncbi:MAG: FAD binding domain-containing protein [bacterium]
MLTTFDYLAPENKEQLFDLLDENREGVSLLSGGTDLLVDIRNGIVSPDTVVDIKKIEEFGRLTFDESEGLSIGAAVTCAELINNQAVQKKFPFLIEAAEDLASPQLRNRATVVGNVCKASPCGDMSRILLALEATAVISSSKGSREVALEDFFTGVQKTVLEDNEIMEKIVVPAEMTEFKGGNKKLKRIKGHDLALASVSVVKNSKKMNIAIGSCCTTPVLIKDLDPDIPANKLCEIIDETIAPIDDQRASKEYRVFMVKNYAKKLLAELN